MSVKTKRHFLVDLEALELIPKIGAPIDLKQIYLSLEIFDNLMNIGPVGVIVLNDHAGILEFAPILGGEKIRVKFTTNKKDGYGYIDKTFTIFSVKREASANKANVKDTNIIIQFETEFGYKNSKEQYSKSWKQLYTHTIAEDILTNMIGGNFIKNEPSKNQIDFVMPYSQPYQAINFLANKSESKVWNDTGYIFYENLDGFYFRTWTDIIMNGGVKVKFRHVKIDEDKQYIGNITNGKILKSVFDLHKNFMDRGWGQTSYWFSYEDKYFERWEDDILNYKDITGNVGNWLYWNKEEMSNIKKYSYNEVVDDKIFKNSNMWNCMRWNLLSDYELILQSSGNSELRAGDLVELDYESHDKKESTNKKLKGKWIVIGVKHKIVGGDYINNVYLTKDSFFDMTVTSEVDQHQLVHKINNNKNP